MMFTILSFHDTKLSLAAILWFKSTQAPECAYTLSLLVCRPLIHSFKFQFWCAYLVLSSLRVYAIWSRNRTAAVVILSLGLMNPCLIAVSHNPLIHIFYTDDFSLVREFKAWYRTSTFSIHWMSHPWPPYRCLVSPRHIHVMIHIYWSLCVAIAVGLISINHSPTPVNDAATDICEMCFTLVTELAVLVLTWMKTARARNELSQARADTPLMTLLLRDGACFFQLSHILLTYFPLRHMLLHVRIIVQ